MSETPVRFGVLGCATIARILSRAIRLAPNASISAIGSRSIDKASKFASDDGFPASAKVYGSYEAVLDDPEVDAVYLPLPTSLHLKWAVLAAEKKKHLLLEKPVRTLIQESFKEVLDKNDILISPAAPSAAYEIGEKKNDPLAMYVGDIMTVNVNLAGLPALVLPCRFVEGGSTCLPVGFQMIGAAFDEADSVLVAQADYDLCGQIRRPLSSLKHWIVMLLTMLLQKPKLNLKDAFMD
ncbi:putative oxidoreductase [Camellia lanceoleosa]|uniref:Oxidoreductase n=1 Tax=Camellia lanceoleosa TaxID=1840588 RepID=A0ACC0GRW0_9ERIC|nr:putative oxidoreductase [Camellia lanceoleosa]